MNKIIEARFIAPDIKFFRIEAPKIAEKRKPGQFVVVRVNELGERIPLTIADSSKDDGTITIIAQGVGKTTKELNLLNAGDFIRDVVGPLGKPSEIENFGIAVSIGGGVGTAIAYPTAKALKEAGNYVIGIIGGRSKEFVILESEMREICDELYPTTDDGSYGFHGFVTHKLQQLIDEGRKIDFVLAIGPIPMMKAVAEVTRPHGIKTVVSLNPIMVDATGMCGGCRVTVDNKTYFACVDGPEFDAHKVDFDLLMKRNRMYIEHERKSLENFICHIDLMASKVEKQNA
ncbi:MAG: sulfide/dihydroorotate dehydrogenase-like FAD/NAD-binding protein [Candidatus Kapaibacteriales bacterium]